MNRLILNRTNSVAKSLFNSNTFKSFSTGYGVLRKDIKKDDTEIIETIETNEDNYFKNVKDSFDKLQRGRENETVEEKRSRLIYQSRKRGTLENGLLLSNFSADHLPKMNEKQLNDYDSIINNLHNEWELYYWLTDAKPIPEEIKSNEVIHLMKKYCSNELKQSRILQPDLANLAEINHFIGLLTHLLFV